MKCAATTYCAVPRSLRTALAAVLLALRLAPALADPPPAAPEFGGQCVEGLASGQHVMTNCALTWTKDGKTYCFSSEAARKSFWSRTRTRRPRLQRREQRESSSRRCRTQQRAMPDVVKGHIDQQLKANGGLYPLQDPLNGNEMKLAYDGIDFTRTIDGYGFFPDVKFHDPADAQKRYLIDFWVAPANGVLKIQEVRIYKEPVKAEGKWVLTARSPVPWWWIPASEHPGHMAQKRGWEVMSAVEQGALAEAAKNHGVYKLQDDKTGKTLELEFIDTHQPIRQLDDNGHYCVPTSAPSAPRIRSTTSTLDQRQTAR
jgi:hypothetical protein